MLAHFHPIEIRDVYPQHEHFVLSILRFRFVFVWISKIRREKIAFQHRALDRRNYSVFIQHNLGTHSMLFTMVKRWNKTIELDYNCPWLMCSFLIEWGVRVDAIFFFAIHNLCGYIYHQWIREYTEFDDVRVRTLITRHQFIECITHLDITLYSLFCRLRMLAHFGADRSPSNN